MSQPPQIENFEIVDRLGQGGMATVWKARQASLDRMVAIKVLAANFATDPADVARFREEARAAGRLKHPGIVQVYDANFRDGIYYFVMELVDGYTVGEWIRRKERLSENDALTVAESVVAALDYAWTHFGIIHCDIKSENIMVDADGTVKVTDLGLARAISSMQTLEQEQEVLGTPAFMSPEQVTGQPDLDCRADIYALGATIYHMVTGHLLFARGGTDDEIMQKQLAASVPSPSREVSGLTHGFVLLLAKMLAKDRKYRPQDWKQVRADIRRVREHRIPMGTETPPGASTILIDADVSDTTRRRVLRGLESTEPAPAENAWNGGRIWLGLATLGAIVLCFWFLLRNRDIPSSAPSTTVPAACAADEACYKDAMSYVAANPMDFTGGIARLDVPLARFPASWYAQQARLERDRLRAAYQSEVQAVCGNLDAQARALVSSGREYEAARRMDLYRGRYAAETANWRREQALLLRGGGAQAVRTNTPPQPPRLIQPKPDKRDVPPEPPRPPTPAPAEAIQQLARAVAQNGLDAAQKQTKKRLAEHADWEQHREFAAWRLLLDQTVACQHEVIQTFAAEQGKTITVRLVAGEVQGRIGKVSKGKVQLTLSAGEEKTVGIDDLDASERIKRLGRVENSGDGGRFLMGVWALRAHATERAREYFSTLPAPAGPALIQAVKANP